MLRNRITAVRLTAHRQTAEPAITPEAAERMEYGALLRWRDAYDTTAFVAEMRGDVHTQARAEATVRVLDAAMAEIERRAYEDDVVPGSLALIGG